MTFLYILIKNSREYLEQDSKRKNIVLSSFRNNKIEKSIRCRDSNQSLACDFEG